MRFTRTVSTKFVIALLLISVIGTAVAMVTLFTQSFSFVTVSLPPAVIATSCMTLTSEGPVPLQGISGNVTFDCGVAVAAFHATGVAGTVTPTFTLPSGYTSLIAVGRPGTSPTCTSFTSTIPLSSTVGIAFAAGANNLYVYCALYTSAPAGNFASFNVVWTQV